MVSKRRLLALATRAPQLRSYAIAAEESNKGVVSYRAAVHYLKLV